jgi:hypothetical protein
MCIPSPPSFSFDDDIVPPSPHPADDWNWNWAYEWGEVSPAASPIQKPLTTAPVSSVESSISSVESSISSVPSTKSEDSSVEPLHSRGSPVYVNRTRRYMGIQNQGQADYIEDLGFESYHETSSSM